MGLLEGTGSVESELGEVLAELTSESEWAEEGVFTKVEFTTFAYFLP